MTIATRELRASFAFVERNFNLTKRYWGWEVAWLVYSLAAALSVAFIGVAQDDPALLQVLVTATVFLLLGSISFVGVGMMAAILPLLYVERGDQMVFVIQSVILLFSGVYYTPDTLPGWMQFVGQ